MPQAHSSNHKTVLLIVTGGIAAYKSLDLVRRLREQGHTIRPVLTQGGSAFITPLALASLAGSPVYTDLFSLTEEAEMGHIRLAREADCVVIAPATADFIAKMAAGRADDLASTLMLVTHAPVLLAPSMNASMWAHPATQDNVSCLKQRGCYFVGPDAGVLACNEKGYGRMSDVSTILDAIAQLPPASSLLNVLSSTSTSPKPLIGRRALVTSGPTREPIDPVRYISNHSSGQQGHAIAAALAANGAQVTLISGPVTCPTPAGVEVISVQTAQEMLVACQNTLPVDIAVCVAAVADWRVENVAVQKIKKTAENPEPSLRLIPNTDILATLASSPQNRPTVVVGFAAETENILENARAKRLRKGCDLIVANTVALGSQTFGGTHNTVTLIGENFEEKWPSLTKEDVAEKLTHKIIGMLEALS